MVPEQTILLQDANTKDCQTRMLQIGEEPRRLTIYCQGYEYQCNDSAVLASASSQLCQSLQDLVACQLVPKRAVGPDVSIHHCLVLS